MAFSVPSPLRSWPGGGPGWLSQVLSCANQSQTSQPPKLVRLYLSLAAGGKAEGKAAENGKWYGMGWQ